MQATFTTRAPVTTDADTIVVGLHTEDALHRASEDGDPPLGLPEELAALVRSGEARVSFKSLAVGHAHGKRWLLVGLGSRRELTSERLRVAAALARGRARELSALRLCWQAPLDANGAPDPDLAAALVEGTILADYRFEAFRSSRPKNDSEAPEPPKRLEALLVSCAAAEAIAERMSRAVSQAQVVAEAVNDARDLQNRPANHLTPTALAEHAEELAKAIDGLTVKIEGREGILARGMGAFAAVAQGSAQEPALITMRYEPPVADAEQGATDLGDAGRGDANLSDAGHHAADPRDQGRDVGPELAIVGKAVTFDSGGISLKPGAKMSEMKFDMSGGAAAIAAIAAIAKLRLPIRTVAVIGATENLPSGTAVKPGDIVTAANRKTIEINNTDAEGRLVLADCLCHAVSLRPRRIVDLATLTGAVLIALGSTHAGLVSNDDDLAAEVTDAGRRSGEIVWRLPMHEEYHELLKGTYADLDNAPEGRKAGTIVGASFLSNFVGDTPWAHLDIAGCAWDLGRAYAPKQAAGYGVRLLVELARSYCP